MNVARARNLAVVLIFLTGFLHVALVWIYGLFEFRQFAYAFAFMGIIYIALMPGVIIGKKRFYGLTMIYAIVILSIWAYSKIGVLGEAFGGPYPEIDFWQVFVKGIEAILVIDLLALLLTPTVPAAVPAAPAPQPH